MQMHNDKLCDVCGAYFFDGDTVNVTKYETEVCDTCTDNQTESMIAHLFYERGEVEGDG